MSEEAIRQEIVECERQRCEALMSGDVTALGELVADELIHIHGNGQMDDRAAYLHGIQHKYIFHRIERGDLNIRLFHDLAVVCGPLKQAVSVRGGDVIHQISAMTTQTWVRTESGWKQNTCHMGFLPAN